jgi:tetratricopeptide (TPR) repeat protein
MVEKNPDRVSELEWLAHRSDLSAGTRALAIAIGRGKLSTTPLDDEERARILNNLSLHLADAGDGAAALAAIRDAVELDRRLAAASPARFEPELAQSLNNLSIRLAEAGEGAAALAAIEEAVAIRRIWAGIVPRRFRPLLARSLRNLARHLDAAGRRAAADVARSEAAGIDAAER